MTREPLGLPCGRVWFCGPSHGKMKGQQGPAGDNAGWTPCSWTVADGWAAPLVSPHPHHLFRHLCSPWGGSSPRLLATISRIRAGRGVGKACQPSPRTVSARSSLLAVGLRTVSSSF